MGKRPKVQHAIFHLWRRHAAQFNVYNCRNVSVFVPVEGDRTVALCEKARTTMPVQH